MSPPNPMATVQEYYDTEGVDLDFLDENLTGVEGESDINFITSVWVERMENLPKDYQARVRQILMKCVELKIVDGRFH